MLRLRGVGESDGFGWRRPGQSPEGPGEVMHGFERCLVLKCEGTGNVPKLEQHSPCFMGLWRPPEVAPK